MVLRLALAVVLAVSVLSLDASAQRRGYGGYNGYGGITVYEHPDFRGDSVTFRNEVPDLREHGLNDRISSLEINSNQAWEVCRDVFFAGGCRVFSGTIDDLRAAGWNDRISSMRVAGYARSNGNNNGGWWGGWGNNSRNNRQSRLVFYERTNFRGDSRDIFNNSSNLGSFGDRARSVEVYGGTWELCEGGSFRNARCVTVSQSISDLRNLGLRNGVTSAREVGYQNQNQNRGRWW